jgi:hypothetical protein
VPHDRRHLFILHSGVQQVIEKPASEELHFSAAKSLGMSAATAVPLHHQTTIEAIE